VNKLNVTMLQGKQMLCSCWYTQINGKSVAFPIFSHKLLICWIW